MLSKIFPAILVLSACAALAAQQSQTAPQPTTAADAPHRDTSFIDENGTAHVTRVVPVPENLSPEARKSLSRVEPDQVPPESLEERRKKNR